MCPHRHYKPKEVRPHYQNKVVNLIMIVLGLAAAAGLFWAVKTLLG